MRQDAVPGARHAVALEVALLLVMLSWGLNFVVMKSALVRIPPIGYSLISFSIGGLLLLAIASRRRELALLPRARLRTIIVLGGLGFGFNQLLFPTGLERTAASTAALLIGSTPVVVMGISIALRFEPWSSRKALGGIVSLIGVALVVGAGDGLGDTDQLLGDLLVMGAVLCWSTYLSLSSRYLGDLPSVAVTACAMLSGAALILAPGAAQLVLGWHEVRTGDLTAMAYTGIVSSVGNAVVLTGSRRLGLTRVTQFQFLVPAAAAAFAALLLSETIGPHAIAGGALIIAGIAYARRGGPPRSADVPAPSGPGER